MNTRDEFVISAFKMLSSVVALAIILPMVDNLTDISFYVTVSVYVLGKFIDLVAKLRERHLKIFFVIYTFGMIVGLLSLSMCFYAFANTGSDSGASGNLAFNYTLLGMTAAFCFIDVSDFVFCICRLSYTKNKLKQFS